MAKSGWKKGHDVNYVSRHTMSEKSSSNEAKQAFSTPELPDPPLKRQRLDLLTEYLSCTRYYQSKRWEWFYQRVGGINYPLAVSRFYDEIGLAIDIAPMEKSIIGIKKNLLKDHGIKYVVIESPTDINSLVQNEL